MFSGARCRSTAFASRRALLLGGPVPPEEIGLGLILLGGDDSIELANAAARELIDELGPEGADCEWVPIVIQAVAVRARAAAAGRAPEDSTPGPESGRARDAGWSCTAR